MNWIIHNGDIVQAGDAQIPIQSRAVAYGDGCFETIRCYEGRFLELDKHLDRLQAAMDYLGLDIIDQLSHSALKEQLEQLVTQNKAAGQQSVIRLQVWREGSLGYKPDAKAGVGWTITMKPLPGNISDPASLVQVRTRRIPQDALSCSFKLSNGINYIRASLEAREHNADDALMLTINDYVSETTIANIFWLKGQTIYTPNLECDILPGITRGILSSIIRNRSEYKLVKGRFEAKELDNAEAVWVCNSLREIRPVKRIGENTYKTKHPVYKKLRKEFKNYKKEHLESLA